MWGFESPLAHDTTQPKGCVGVFGLRRFAQVCLFCLVQLCNERRRELAFSERGCGRELHGVLHACRDLFLRQRAPCRPQRP